MSVTLNNSDFQCLQDQILDLKTKNYELAEKNRRGQADFEAAKAKICTLQLKLEEQERDFQVISTTLRREIEAATNSENKAITDEGTAVEMRKLTLNSEELKQRNKELVEVMQQMDSQNKCLNEQMCKFKDENSKLRENLESLQQQFNVIKEEYETKSNATMTEYKTLIREERRKNTAKLETINAEREALKAERDELNRNIDNYVRKLASQTEEQKINERKSLRLVKELKRQLTLEKGRTETLQKRLENLLSETSTVSNADLEATDIRLSTSSSTNGNSSTSNDNGSRTNQDSNSVSSWSLVPKKTKSNKSAQSICSINSDDRGTIQQNLSGQQDYSALQDESSETRPDTCEFNVDSPNTNNSLDNYSLQSKIDNLKQSLNSNSYSNLNASVTDGMLIEEQKALVERLTKMQHEKWILEEKLSYLEQANSSLYEDLANKSDIIKNYFMDQAAKFTNNNHGLDTGAPSILNALNAGASRRSSLSTNLNQLLSDKPSIKKVVDFVKERSQISSSDSENISKEAMKKMQLMLEETLTKCLKLQENLDFVTSRLNDTKA